MQSRCTPDFDTNTPAEQLRYDSEPQDPRGEQGAQTRQAIWNVFPGFRTHCKAAVGLQLWHQRDTQVSRVQSRVHKQTLTFGQLIF